jgi:hypothetical protein
VAGSGGVGVGAGAGVGATVESEAAGGGIDIGGRVKSRAGEKLGVGVHPKLLEFKHMTVILGSRHLQGIFRAL